MKVPANVAAGKGAPYPQGSFAGDLGDVKEAWNEAQTGLDYLLTFTKNVPVNGPEVGARTFTQRVTIIFPKKVEGGKIESVSVVDIEDFANAPFALVRSVTSITQLAIALGIPMAQSSSGDVEFDINGFLEGLQANLYKSRKVGYEVKHRAWASKDKGLDGKPLKSGVSAEAIRYFSVESNGAYTGNGTVEASPVVGTVTTDGTTIPAMNGTEVQTRR